VRHCQGIKQISHRREQAKYSASNRFGLGRIGLRREEAVVLKNFCSGIRAANVMIWGGRLDLSSGSPSGWGDPETSLFHLPRNCTLNQFHPIGTSGISPAWREVGLAGYDYWNGRTNRKAGRTGSDWTVWQNRSFGSRSFSLKKNGTTKEAGINRLLGYINR